MRKITKFLSQFQVPYILANEAESSIKHEIQDISTQEAPSAVKILDKVNQEVLIESMPLDEFQHQAEMQEISAQGNIVFQKTVIKEEPKEMLLPEHETKNSIEKKQGIKFSIEKPHAPESSHHHSSLTISSKCACSECSKKLDFEQYPGIQVGVVK